jgi:hypothetical protein
MKMTLSNIAISLLVAATGLGMTACDDDAVAAGVAGAVIGAGVAAVIIDRNDNDRCTPSYRTVCSSYYDYYGRLIRDCREVRDSCRYRYERTESALEAFASGNRIQVRQHAESNGLTVEDFAKEYKLGFDNAEKFWAALDASDQGDAAPLNALGLSSEDIQLLGQYKLPTEQGIDNVARSLDQRADITKGMFNRVRAWALKERTRICSKPPANMSRDERKLCNAGY